MNDTLENNSKKIGEFESKEKFLEFIGGKGNINFLSNQATIEGKYLSGLDFDGLTFKITICDNNTIDFEEVGTNMTTKEQRARLLDIICDKTITHFRNRLVISELPFKSVEKVKDQNIGLYLAVEQKKPIDKLAELFDDNTLEVSDDAMDNLNDLLNSWFEDDEFSTEISEMISEDKAQSSEDETQDTFMQHHDTNFNTLVQTSFLNMKQEKIKELMNEKKLKEKDIQKYENDILFYQSKVDSLNNEVKLIEDRLNDLQPNKESNGFVFNVSERQNEVVVLESEIESIIKDKISKVKGINVENFMKLFTSGEYVINISKKLENEFNNIQKIEDLGSELYEELFKIGVLFSEDKFIYNGEMSWSEIVNIMIKNGFTQDSDYDQLCGSNSFQSK